MLIIIHKCGITFVFFRGGPSLYLASFPALVLAQVLSPVGFCCPRGMRGGQCGVAWLFSVALGKEVLVIGLTLTRKSS